MSDDAETRKEIRRLEQKARDFSKAANTRERAANKAGKNSKVYATYINMLKQASELRQQASKLKSGTVKGGGGGTSATGLGIKAPAGPSPRKKLKMLSKGGYMNPIKIVDNLRNK